MTKKAYLSTLSPKWTLDAQREKLGKREAEYVDILGPTLLARVRDPAAKPADRDACLKQRATMLRPTSRTTPEEIEVASFLCLAPNMADFLDVVARASARNATLVDLSTGRRITGGQGAEELAREIPFFREALRGRANGTRTEYAAKIEADGRARAIAVADLWKLPNEEAPIDMIRERAGRPGKPMAPATLVKHLGVRRDAQRLYQAGLKRSATAAAKREEQANAE